MPRVACTFRLKSPLVAHSLYNYFEAQSKITDSESFDKSGKEPVGSLAFFKRSSCLTFARSETKSDTGLCFESFAMVYLYEKMRFEFVTTATAADNFTLLNEYYIFECSKSEITHKDGDREIFCGRPIAYNANYRATSSRIEIWNFLKKPQHTIYFPITGEGRRLPDAIVILLPRDYQGTLDKKEFYQIARVAFIGFRFRKRALSEKAFHSLDKEFILKKYSKDKKVWVETSETPQFRQAIDLYKQTPLQILISGASNHNIKEPLDEHRIIIDKSQLKLLFTDNAALEAIDNKCKDLPDSTKGNDESSDEDEPPLKRDIIAKLAQNSRRRPNEKDENDSRPRQPTRPVRTAAKRAIVEINKHAILDYMHSPGDNKKDEDYLPVEKYNKL